MKNYYDSTAVQPDVCTNRGFRGGFAARRPMGTFWYFFQKVISNLVWYTDAVELASTCAGLSAAMLQEFESWLYFKI
jgi:hypothetical protein